MATDKDTSLDLIPNVNNSLEKPEDTSWGDYMLRPDRPLSHRHRELARLAAHGKSNKEISRALNLTESRVSVLLSSTKIKHAIEEYRDKIFAVDTETRMKDLVPDALNAMEEILLSDKIEAKDKENAARWVIEKVTGKPSQQVDIKAEVSIGALFDKLDKMNMKEVVPSHSEGDVIEVAVKPSQSSTESSQPEDDFTSWLEKHM